MLAEPVTQTYILLKGKSEVMEKFCNIAVSFTSDTCIYMHICQVVGDATGVIEVWAYINLHSGTFIFQFYLLLDLLSTQSVKHKSRASKCARNIKVLHHYSIKHQTYQIPEMLQRSGK